MSEYVYSLADFPGCLDHEGKQIVSFTLRTTNGKDEQYAARQADARRTTMSEELIRLSIVSYQRAGASAEIETCAAAQPFVAFDDWSTRARNFAVAAWQKLSTPDEKELADFFASATVREPGA